MFDDARGLSRLTRDFAFALRMALRKPGFTVVLLLTLALGIGLTTAIFSVFYGVLLKPLPFHDPDRLVLIKEKIPDAPAPIDLPPSDALEFSANPAFNGTAMFVASARNLQVGERPERIDVLRASASVLPLLGISPSRGRAFTEREDAESARVAVISDSFEQSRFGNGGAIGKTLLLDGAAYEIVGVLPQRFTVPLAEVSQSLRSTDVCIPLSLTPAERSPQNPDYSYSLVARLKPGVSPYQAQAMASGAVERILGQLPPERRGKFQIQAVVLPLKEQVISGSHRLLVLLLAAVSVLLLISCMNVSNMLLTHVFARRRELAVRLSLGADRKTILLQLVTETLFFFIAGGALGVVCAAWSQHALVRLLPPDLPRLGDLHMDVRVLAFAFAVSIVLGLVFGLAPALTVLRTDLAPNMNDGSRSQTAGRVTGKTRRALVVAQLALAFLLLTGAGLLLRSFSSVLDQQTFLRTDRVLSFGIALPKTQYPEPARKEAFYKELARRLGALPGVVSVGFGTDIPFGNKSGRLITPDRAVAQGNPIIYNTDVAGAYFESVGLPVLKGRVLAADGTHSPEPVALVNQAFGKAYWATDDALDKRFKFGPASAAGPWVRIVGVVADSGARTPDEPSEPRIYVPWEQDPYKDSAEEMWFVLRSHGAALPLTSSVQGAVHSLDPSAPVLQLRSMAQVVANAVAPRSANTWLITVFSLAALLLSSLGIYAVVAQFVTQRTHELGIRMALGATSSDVSRMVLSEGGRLFLMGLAVGAPASFAASRLVRSLLFSVSPEDWLTRIAVIGAMVITVIAALIVPLWRAVNVDPQSALRQS